MGTPEAVRNRRAEAARLEQRLIELQNQIHQLEKERGEAQARLEALRLQLTVCPRCGREESFLTDAGGVLIHVLEDPDDTELLTPGKPLFCPTCGDVFLYQGGLAAKQALPAAAKARAAGKKA